MGHDLMVIEEEYITRYTGCCVNPGIGVTVRAIGDTENLAKFSKENSCSLSGDINLKAQFDDVAIKFKVSRGRYASLSCRDNDALR